MPGLILDLGDLHLILRVAEYEAVLIAVFVDPGEIAGAVVVVVYSLAEIEGIAGLMLTESGLCHTV